MAVFYCPDCWFDDTDLKVLKEHIRTAHPEHIDTSIEIKVDIYIEPHGPKSKKD